MIEDSIFFVDKCLEVITSYIGDIGDTMVYNERNPITINSLFLGINGYNI